MSADVPATLTTRSCVPEDADFVFSLMERTSRDYVIATYGAWDPERQRERFNQRFAPGNISVLRLDGQDIGILWVEERDGTLFLANLHVLPELQRRGLGTAAIRIFLADASKRGLAATLQVLRVNPARRFYERLGFRIAWETETHFLMRYSKGGTAHQFEDPESPEIDRPTGGDV
jgi:ribosomal protein S18 acetylase RimI-like enzyme